jgi:hypothetical protein
MEKTYLSGFYETGTVVSLYGTAEAVPFLKTEFSRRI